MREGGAMMVAELARQLKRDYKNLYNDCERLIEWMAIEKDESGSVFELPLSGGDSSELKGGKVPIAKLRLDIPFDSLNNAP